MSVFRGASVGVTLTANKSKYSRELKQARAELKDWERTNAKTMASARRGVGLFGKAAATGFAVAGVAAVGASAKMIQMASDANETASKMKVTFGSSMGSIVKDLDAFSKATGASRYELREQATTIGALLKPMKLGAAETAKMSVNVTKLATDLSSFNNVPVEDALQSLKSGLTGEAEPLKKFGILINDAALKSEGLRLKLVKGKEAMSEQQKVQARLSLIMKQTSDAQGDATRTSEGFANTTRRLQNSIKDAGTEIGERMLPSVTKLAGGLATFVQGDTFKGWVDSAGDTAERAASSISGFLRSAEGKEAIEDLGKTVMSFGHGVADVTRFVIEHRTAIMNLAVGYGAFRAVTSILTPLNAAWQLGQVRAREFAAENAGATRSAILSRGAMSAMGGPIGVAAAGIGILAAGVFAYKRHQDDANEASRRATDALYAQAAAAGTLYESQLALRGARLDVADATAAVNRAAAAAKDTTPGTQAAAEAARVLARAKLNLSNAQVRAADTAEAENKKQAQAVSGAQNAARKLNEIARARAELDRALKARRDPNNTQDEQVIANRRAQVAKAALEKIEGSEKKHVAALRTLRDQGRGDFKRIGDKYVIEEGQAAAKAAALRRKHVALGNQWSSQELSKMATLARPHVAAANREIEKTGKINRAQMAANIAATFRGLGGLISGSIGKIRVGIDAVINLMGGAGDAFDAAGLPAGVKPQLGPFAGLGQAMGLGISPGAVRPAGTRTASGGISDHTTGNALDLSGPPAAMRRFAQAARRMPRVKQVIYSPLGLSNGGSDFGPIGNAAVQRMHFNHVHVAAFQRGGRVGGYGEGDKVPAMLEPDEVVVNRRFTRSFPGGPQGFHNATNGLVPRFQTGGFLGAARTQAAIAASPAMALNQVRMQFTQAMNALTALRRGGVSKAEKQRVADLTEKLRSMAADIAQRERDSAQTQRDANAATIQAIKDQETADADQRAQARADEDQRLKDVRQSQLEIPRAAMTLTDAIRDLDRAVAESTETLDDDVAVNRQALEDERARRQLIENVLARTDLTDAERAEALGQKAASIRNSTSLEKAISDATTTGTGKVGATIDDLIAQLRSTTQALYQMGANEASNVIHVAKVEQSFPAGTGLDTWRLATTAQLQGAAG